MPNQTGLYLDGTHGGAELHQRLVQLSWSLTLLNELTSSFPVHLYSKQQMRDAEVQRNQCNFCIERAPHHENLMSCLFFGSAPTARKRASTRITFPSTRGS